MPLETLYFCYRLILLLGNVMHYQSSMQYCPIRTVVGVNFTSVAGSPFFFNILLPGTVDHMEHYQVSLADGDVLPHWMVFRPKSGSLEGLAVTEDCGTYHLKVSVTSELCTAYLAVYILTATIIDKEPQSPQAQWNTLPCSEKERRVWANLILQMNPDEPSLDANLRIHLVNTMASYLHKQTGFVSLFLRQKSFILEENIIICRRGVAEDALGEVGELLWPVGCQGQDQQSDLAKVLEDTTQTGVLARLLGTPVLGWRMLCAADVARHKVKRDTQRSKSTTGNTNPSPPNHIRQVELSFRNKQEPQDASDATLSMFFNTREAFLLGSLKGTSAPKLDEYLDTTKTFVKEINTQQSLEEVSEVSSGATKFHMKKLTFSENSNICENVALWESSLSTCQSFLDAHVTSDLSGSFLFTFKPYSIYTVIPLTSNYFSVTSTVTHAVVNRETLTTRLTRRPHQRENPIWTRAYRATHSDSESHSTVSSLGQTNYSQDFIKDFNTTKASLYNSPSVSHPPLAENNNDLLLLNSRLTSIQSPLPSNKTPSTQTLSDVSLVSYAMTELLSIPEQFTTVQHLPQTPSGVNRLMSQLNVTIKDTSSTTSQSQLILPGQNDLESSLSPSLLYTPEPSDTALTPPLPSELSFSGQLETSDHKLAFTVESLKASLSSVQLLQTCCKTSLESQFVTELESKSKMQNGTEFHFDQNGLTRVTDVLVTYPLHVSLSSTNASSSSVEQTLLHSQMHKESLQSVTNALSSLISESSAAQTPSKQYSLDAAAVTPDLSFSAPFPTQLSESESIRSVTLSLFDSMTPSAVREPNSASSIHEMLSLEPSFPLCDHHMYASRCTLSVHVTYPDNTLENVLNFLSSRSYDGEHWTALQSQFLSFDSSLSTFLTDTGSYVEYISVVSESAFSEFTLVKSSRLTHFISFMSTEDVSSTTTSAWSEINSLTATQLMHSDTQGPLYVSGLFLTIYTSLTMSTSVLNGYCVTVKNSWLICQSSVQDSINPVSNGSPTQQMSTISSQSSGILASLIHTVSHSSSSVQASSSSSSISSLINLPPKVLQTIPPLTATVGFPFLYSVPKQTFIDPEDGQADTLSLQMRLIDGPPPGMGSWLVLDGLQLHGVPLEVDRRFTPQHLLLEATDTQGLSTRLHLRLDLHPSPMEPCHVFTLKVQVSLHSILRHRHQVELLLRKITGFFNSSRGHLSVVSVAPGSTVSWYNYSLCETPHCHVDKVKSMWLAMSSRDEEVNPVFREAMLPEFPVVKVGLVSNKHDCFSATPTSTFSQPTPALHTTLCPASDTSSSTSTISVPASTAIISTSEQTDSYEWMAGMLTGLLVVCILILIALLVATILYFCQRRSRIVAIWPASRMLSVQSKNSRAIRPRRPPLFLPELPPPPLRLWINLTQEDEEPLPSAGQQGIPDRAPQRHAPKHTFSNI